MSQAKVVVTAVNGVRTFSFGEFLSETIPGEFIGDRKEIVRAREFSLNTKFIPHDPQSLHRWLLDGTKQYELFS